MTRRGRFGKGANMVDPKNAELVMHGAQRFKRGAYSQASETGQKGAYTGGANTLREQGFGDWFPDRDRKADQKKVRKGKQISRRSSGDGKKQAGKFAGKKRNKWTAGSKG